VKDVRPPPPRSTSSLEIALSAGGVVDFGVDERHGTNAFFRDGDRLLRTRVVDNRGDEAIGSTWSYLDMVLGRQEEREGSPEAHPQTPPDDWWNWHVEYGAGDEALHA
jgi:predicted dithiol-disulfide oxidoreductase (DUF899 family)